MAAPSRPAAARNAARNHCACGRGSDVGDFAGGEILSAESSAPLRFEGLALRQGTATRIILASLLSTPQQVHIQHGGSTAHVRMLDERNAEAAMRDPEYFRAQAGELVETPAGSLMLELLPYVIARIDI
jgi:hypothetical protein